MRGLPVVLAFGFLAGPVFADVPPEGLISPKGLKGIVRLDRLPQPTDPVLARGREVWGGTCVNCHGGNRATGAPKITSADDWAPRVTQGIDVLFSRAVDGFMGPKFTEMPPRGGTELPDEDIFAAVAFMIWASGSADVALRYIETKD